MHRSRLPEIMDQPGLDPEIHANALRSLNLANRLLGTNRQLYAAVRRMECSPGISVLDLGTGGGSFLGHIDRRLNGTVGRLLIGLDRSAFALQRARQWHGSSILGVAADIRHLPLVADSVDVVTCSLLLHHFEADEVVLMLREAARVARRGIVMGDLTRSRLSLAVTWTIARLASRSEVFRVDAPRSVQAAFRPAELAGLANRAGLHGARVERRFPFRMILSWQKRGGAGDAH